RGERRPNLAPGGTVATLEERPLALLGVWLERDQRVIDGTIHRHPAGLAALGLVERQARAAEVHALPLQAEDLGLPHSRVHRDGDDGSEIRIAGLLAGLQ